jgi:autotransporter-associated beta strand protein
LFDNVWLKQEFISSSIINSLNAYTASLKTATLISGAAQITALGFVSSSSTPAGTISGSSQLTASFDTRYAPSASYLTSLNGAISSSTQLTSSLDLRYQLSGSAGVVPAGTISGSSQLTSSFDGRYVLETETGSLQNSLTSLNTLTSSLATTGSNSFNGNQIVTGSLTVSSIATISASIAANASALTLSSGSNFYIQNNGIAEITGSLIVSGSSTLTGSISISSGSIIMPNRPAFRVIGAGGPTTAPTILSGSMVVVDFNQGNHFNTTNGLFTAPIAGLYQVNLVIRTHSNTNSTINQAIVYKSGSGGDVPQIMVEFGTNTTMNHTGGSTISRLAVGETLRAVIAVGTASFDGNDNFSVAYIG